MSTEARFAVIMPLIMTFVTSLAGTAAVLLVRQGVAGFALGPWAHAMMVAYPAAALVGVIGFRSVRRLATALAAR